MTLAQIKDWIKLIFKAEYYYIGKLDNKQEKSLGIYSLKTNQEPIMAIGGNSTYNVCGVSLLLHWNNNANDTQVMAQRLYESLRTVKNVKINDTSVYMIKLLQCEPVDIGTDEKGIYEQVIELQIYFERK